MGFRRGLKIFVGHVGVGVVAPAGPHLLAKKPIRATFPRNHVATAAVTEVTRKAAILAADSGVFANNSSTDLLDKALVEHEPCADASTAAEAEPFDPEFPSEIFEGLIEAVKSTYTSFENMIEAKTASLPKFPIVCTVTASIQPKPKLRKAAKRTTAAVPTLDSILEEAEELGEPLSCPFELSIVDDANVDAQTKPETIIMADCTTTATATLAPLSLAELIQEAADFIEPSSLKRLIKICADGEWVPNKYTAAKLVMFELRLESIPEVDEPTPEEANQVSGHVEHPSSALKSIATVPAQFVDSVYPMESSLAEVAQSPRDIERRAAETKADEQEQEQHTSSMRGEGLPIAPKLPAAPASAIKIEIKSSEIHLTASTTDTTVNADATFADVLSATSAVVAEVKEMDIVESCELAVPDGGSCDTTTAIIAAVPQQCVVGRHLAAEPLAVDGIATSPLHRRLPVQADASLLPESGEDKDGNSVQEQQQSVQVQDHLDYQSALLKVDARVEPAQLEASSSAATSSKVAVVGSVAPSPQGRREHGKPMGVKKPQWIRKLCARIAAVRAWFVASP
ncbi:hypothetical protein H9P43_006157 [Blastocladiella emersonii ATCC 22665]|nr:hypothetical protein H9P43_006152 [Blastocladiella emersonii ATCC 22665]KAI9175793.1 hypothetical protein H9P43_006157 [Blastocladiella emersonii ATCC 22665]